MTEDFPKPYDARTDRTLFHGLSSTGAFLLWKRRFRSASLMLENGDGSMSCDMRYKNYTIRDGKYSLPGLPAVYADNDEAQTLEIVLEDPATGVEAMLLYGVLPELDIITRSVYIRNQSSEKIYVNKVMSAELDFLYGIMTCLLLRKTCHGAESAESTRWLCWKSDDRQCPWHI